MFIPSKEKGTVDVTFIFDGSSLSGSEIVVFEKAYDVKTDTEVAGHEDINDEGQSVVIPKMGTKASEASGKTNIIKAEKDQKITDEVSYEKLLAGKKYTLTTWLTKDGKKIRGTEVTKEFTAAAADGTVKAELTFDASMYGGDNITVFEELRLDGKTVAEHKDKDDKDQMIKVTAPKADVPKTGDSSHMLLWIILTASMTVIGSGILVNEYVQKRNKK